MELLFKELSFILNGLAIEVRKEIGRFGREKQYSDLYEKKLIEKGIVFVREQAVGDTGNRLDFIIENQIALEMKAKPFVIKEDYFQVQRYLHVLNIELGIIYNFREMFVKPHRILRIK